MSTKNINKISVYFPLFLIYLMTFSVSQIIVLNARMISEYWTGQDVKRSDDLIWGTVLAFPWRE
jgi:hypothetical protein